MTTLKIKVGEDWIQDDVLYLSVAAAILDGLRRGFEASELQADEIEEVA